MLEDEIFLKLKQVFKKTFNKEIDLSRTTSANDIEKWDSLNHIVLIKNIEAEFQLEIDLFDIIEFENVGDIVAYLQKEIQ